MNACRGNINLPAILTQYESAPLVTTKNLVSDKKQSVKCPVMKMT